LVKVLDDFDPSKSEMQNLIDHKIPIIFDSGKKKWEYLL
jgi:hypothetical protein